MLRTKHKIFILIIISILAGVFLAGCGLQNNQNKTEEPIVTVESDYTYTQMNEQISELEENYSSINVESIGKSLYENDLYSLTLGTGDKNIAVVGGIHGRENITSLLTLKILENYAKVFENSNNLNDQYNLQEILEDVEFYFIPMLNPDGVEIAIDGIESYENKEFFLEANDGNRDFSRWKANGRGVDLNLQFDADWEQVESEENPYYKNYKGPHPESEPESKALGELTREKSFASIISFHHSGEVIYWYYNQSGTEKERDYKLAQQISELNNYDLVEPEESDLTAAGYKDWFISEFNRPGFTIEIGEKDKGDEEPLSAKNIDKYYEENKLILLELASEI